MKRTKRIAAAMCVGAVLTSGLMAQAASPVSVNVFDRTNCIYVEGIRAAFPSADGTDLYPVLLYQDALYMPLRTVGMWMGKNVEWDATTQTVTLSGNVTKQIPNSEDLRGTPISADKTAEPVPEFTILLDGKKLNFTNARGETIYPLVYQGATYLPLRNIGELTGFEVTWYAAKNSEEVDAAFLRTPITDLQETEMTAYVNQLLPKLQEMDDLQKELHNSAVTPLTVNGVKYDFVLSKPESAYQVLPKMKALAEEARNLSRPNAKILDYYGESVEEQLDFIIQNVDSLVARLKNGEQPILDSFAANRDTVCATILGSTNAMLSDCEAMMHLVNQTMVSSF